jgi:hypothetical protein
MNSSDFRDLVAGMDAAYLCAYLQINLRTLKRWKEGTAIVRELIGALASYPAGTRGQVGLTGQLMYKKLAVATSGICCILCSLTSLVFLLPAINQIQHRIQPFDLKA